MNPYYYLGAMWGAIILLGWGVLDYMSGYDQDPCSMAQIDTDTCYYR